MDNLENTSDKLKLNLTLELVADKNKEFAKLFEKYWNLKETYNLNLADLANCEKLIKENERKYYVFANEHVCKIEELKDSKSKLLQAEETIASYKKTYETLREENETLISQSSYDKETIASYQKSYDTLRKELEESNNVKSILHKMYEELYDNYREYKLENEKLKNSLLNLFDYNSFLNKELSRVKNEKAILENNAAKHEKEIEHLSTIISGIENEIYEKMISLVFILK